MFKANKVLRLSHTVTSTTNNIIGLSTETTTHKIRKEKEREKKNTHTLIQQTKNWADLDPILWNKIVTIQLTENIEKNLKSHGEN